MIVDALGYTRKRQVMEETWGHLDPEPGERYPCWFTVSYLDRCTSLIEYGFDGLELGPVQFDDICKYALDLPYDEGIHKFSGWYKKFKNGNCRFGGNFEPMYLYVSPRKTDNGGDYRLVPNAETQV